jgi:hypothetical protein
MRTREEYKEKFDRLFNGYNYIMQPDEKIIQCKEPYPPYLFISNKGYLWSVYHDNLYLMKPHLKPTGRKNKDGNRPSFDWDYCINDRPVKMSKIIADHFLTNEFGADEHQIHHKRKKNTYSLNEPQKCNRADNLQILPKDIHGALTKLSRKTDKQHNEELKDKIIKSGVPIVEMTEQQLEYLLLKAIQSSLEQGIEPVVNICTATDNKDDIVAESYPIKEIKTI